MYHNLELRFICHIVSNFVSDGTTFDGNVFIQAEVFIFLCLQVFVKISYMIIYIMFMYVIFLLASFIAGLITLFNLLSQE